MSAQAGFTPRGRNPDVLTCIANLSNDEVFTPPEYPAPQQHGRRVHRDQPREQPCRAPDEGGVADEEDAEAVGAVWVHGGIASAPVVQME